MTWGRRRTCPPTLRFGRGSPLRPWGRGSSLRFSGGHGAFAVRGLLGRCHYEESGAHLPPSAIGCWSALAEDFDTCSPAFDPNASVGARCIILFDRGAFLPINLSPVSGRLGSTAVQAPAYSDRASTEPQTRSFVLAIGKELIIHCIEPARWKANAPETARTGEGAQMRCRSGMACESRSEGPVVYKSLGDCRCWLRIFADRSDPEFRTGPWLRGRCNCSAARRFVDLEVDPKGNHG